MNASPAPSFNALVAQHLGGQLPEKMVEAISFPALPTDVQDFIPRMFILMQKADFPATDFTPNAHLAACQYHPRVSALRLERDGATPYPPKTPR